MSSKARGGLTPGVYLALGAAFFIYSLARGYFHPLPLLFLCVGASLESLARKQHRLPSFVLSLTGTILFAILFSELVLKCAMMKGSAWEPRIPNRATMFYSPRLKPAVVGNMVVYRGATGRRLVGELTAIRDGTWLIRLPDEPEPLAVPFRRIRGRVVAIISLPRFLGLEQQQ